MHRQQKTLTPSSLILPLAITALVIFLASSANAQNTAPASELPPSPADSVMLREARLAPTSSTNNASPEAPMSPQNDNTILRTNVNVEVDASVSNTRVVANQNLRADLSENRAKWANASVERRAMLERKRAEIASSTLERKAALDSAAQERTRQLSQSLTAILSGAITRMENISSNLRVRAEVVSSQGADTAETVLLLNQIDDLIDQAESSLSGIDVNIEYTVTSEDPKKNWLETKEQFQITAEIIRTIRPLLQEIIATLRGTIQSASDSSVDSI